MTERYYTTSTAFLEALAEAGITHVFANLGSDHPGLIEALAAGGEARQPKVGAGVLGLLGQQPAVALLGIVEQTLLQASVGPA